MNLYSAYDFTIDKNHFCLDVCWDFNLLYLDNFLNYDSLYIDSSLYLANLNVGSTIIAAEQDYGDLLDLLTDMLAQHNNKKVICSTYYIKIIKKKNKLILKYRDKKIDDVSLKLNKKALKNIKRLRKEVIFDFKMMAKNISHLKKLLENES